MLYTSSSLPQLFTDPFPFPSQLCGVPTTTTKANLCYPNVLGCVAFPGSVVNLSLFLKVLNEVARSATSPEATESFISGPRSLGG